MNLDEIFRRERTPALATLIRLLGDFDLAEDALQAAFLAAVDQWTANGIPGNPRSWLISTGRFKAIDTIRRKTRLFSALQDYANSHTEEIDPFVSFDEQTIGDDRLRLIFTCCHPALSAEAQIALTLREVCGLTTEEIARAYLSPPTTIGQRIVRAKAKIRELKIPFELPIPDELPQRVEAALAVVYLLFNEGYYSSFGESLTRIVLSEEAIRLGCLLTELAPEPEVFGLLALMQLQESRRDARTTSDGDVILFDDQDSALWDREMLSDGLAAVTRSLECARPGVYGLQAAIAAQHMQGALAGNRNWPRIVELYDQILLHGGSSIVELNRAVAVAMVEGPESGLEIVNRLINDGGLHGHDLAHSVRADLCRRLGQMNEASVSYSRALELTTQAPQRRFLEMRLQEVSGSA